jgi:hypothetical protein
LPHLIKLVQTIGNVRLIARLISGTSSAKYKRVFSACFLFMPILLLVYHSRPGVWTNPQTLAAGQTARYVEVAGSLHHRLAVLVLLPLICYPVGFSVLERSRMGEPGWILLGFEFLIVLLVVFIQHVRISKAARLLAAQVAKLLNCTTDDAAIPVRAGKLQAPGRPKPNAVKFFSSIESITLLADRDWPNEATKTIVQYWRRKNARRSASAADKAYDVVVVAR